MTKVLLSRFLGGKLGQQLPQEPPWVGELPDGARFAALTDERDGLATPFRGAQELWRCLCGVGNAGGRPQRTRSRKWHSVSPLHQGGPRGDFHSFRLELKN